MLRYTAGAAIGYLVGAWQHNWLGFVIGLFIGITIGAAAALICDHWELRQYKDPEYPKPLSVTSKQAEWLLR